MSKTNNSKTQKIVTLAMLCAMAYAVMLLRIPVVAFLKYEAKDVILLLGGFLYGPLYALIISVVVSLLEMVTVSDTGIIGCVMNIVSSASLVCTASFIYHRRKTLGGAITGLIAGVILMSGVMTLWNLLLTPIYMAVPKEGETTAQAIVRTREMVKGMLSSVFIPFNLFKGSLNAVLTMLMFKPVMTALHKSKLIEPAIIGTRSTKAKWIFIAAGVVFVASIFFLFFNPFTKA